MQAMGKVAAVVAFLAAASLGTLALAQNNNLSSGQVISCDQVLALKKKNVSVQNVIKTHGEWCTTKAGQRRRIIEGYSAEFYGGSN